MDRHIAAVEAVRSRVAHFYESKAAFRVYHGSTNSTRHANFDREAVVDVSSLNNIISIDRETNTAIVEPNVPMDSLVRETMRAGLLPPVVMEFPGITVGGGFVGTAGESSSFKHGFFDRTVISAEVILANGHLVQASSTANQELFDGLRGSFGTLGVLTLVKMQLIEANKYVEVTYNPTHSIQQTMVQLQTETKTSDPEADYVDGILFSKTSGVVVTGRLTDKTPSSTFPLHPFSKPWNEWFWIHARTLSTKSTITTELVPLEDYLFRYDRGAFWMGMYAFKHFMVPFTWLTRFLFDYLMHTRIMYHALHASGHTDRYIIQDVAFPAFNAIDFTHYVDERFKIYPLWLCPVRRDGRSSLGHAKALTGAISDDEQIGRDQCDYINVGVWGPYPSSEAEYVRANRELEKKVQELSGLKWLYSRVFYTEEEWWQIYDKEKYDALREKFHATSLPTIWDKVKDRGRKEELGSGFKGFVKRVIRSSSLLSGVYGVYKAIKGGDYMLNKKEKSA